MVGLHPAQGVTCRWRGPLKKGPHPNSGTASLDLGVKNVKSLSLFIAPCHQLGSRSMDFLTGCSERAFRLLRDAKNVLHTTMTFSEQLWFHLVCLAMYTPFMKSSLFILLVPKTDSLVLIFVNLIKYSAMGLWQFENKKPSL